MNILLFGSTGMLGRYVYNVLKNNYNVMCIKREQFDIENDAWSKLENLLCDNLKENDIIINCAGIIPQKIKNDNFKIYIRVNTKLIKILKLLLIKTKILKLLKLKKRNMKITKIIEFHMKKIKIMKITEFQMRIKKIM